MNVTRVQFDPSNLPSAGETFVFADALSGAPFGGSYGIEFVASLPAPLNIGFAPVPVEANVSTLMTAFVNAFNSVYNQGLLYSVTINSSLNYVDITAINANSVFSETSNDTTGSVVLVFTNTIPLPEILILSTTASESATNPCSTIDVEVTTDVQAGEIFQPIEQAVSTNPFTVNVNRQEEVKFSVSLGVAVDSKKVRAPLLLSAYFGVQVISTPFGASVEVTKDAVWQQSGLYPLILSLEYSFDGGTSWQLSGSQSGLSVGDYTVLIRDNVGCQISLDFSVEGFDGIANFVDYAPIAEISRTNPLGFKVVKIWDSCANPRAVSNTLSYEERSQLNSRNFVQNFQVCDRIPTQVKSNYDEITANLIDCDGNEVGLSVIKKTNNMNNKDIRDCYILDTNGFISFRFVSGNIYNEAGDVTGSYNLGQSAPSWLNSGDYVFLEEYGWAVVDSVMPPNEDRDYYYIVTGNLFPPNYTGVLGRRNCTSYYNTVDYDRYEFTIPENSLEEGYYQVSVNMTAAQSGFEAKSFLSEWFYIQEQYDERHHIIDYYNSEGTEINYATGIRFRLRIPYLRDLKWSPNTEQDVYVTDTKTVSIENRARDFYVLSATPLPTAMAQKLVLALSQDKLRIDGETYTLEGEIESIPLGSTNMYALKATLSKSDYVFTSAGGLTAGELILPSESPLEIDDNADGLLLI